MTHRFRVGMRVDPSHVAQAGERITHRHVEPNVVPGTPAVVERVRAALRRAGFEASTETPATSDAVSVRVRAISAVIVPGHWIDHRNQDVLRAAVPLLQGAPVYSMHWADPTRWLGHCTDPEWDETPMGRDQAPGINCTVVIDPSLSADGARVAAGIAAQSLVRWSLGFDLEAEPSHPDESIDEFWCRLGTFDESGAQRLWVATAIPDVLELSIVDAGAVESARTVDAPDPRLKASEPVRNVRKFRSRGPARRDLSTEK